MEGPKSDLTTASGTWFEVTAQTGIYQPDTQVLDLSGKVGSMAAPSSSAAARIPIADSPVRRRPFPAAAPFRSGENSDLASC
jgi:hypothetical protein